jgi:uncharacterized membrane protein
MRRNRLISGYELYARYLPAVLTALPVLILSFYLAKGEEARELIEYVLSLKFFGTLSMSLVLLYFYAQLIRTTSKAYEKKYFADARGFPTTYFMLYSDRTYSEVFKDEFRKRVSSTLGITLPNKDEEDDKPEEARRMLSEVTKQLILFVGDGVLVGKHNQWYGFFRNLIGGCVYGAIMAAINVLVGFYYLNSSPLVVISVFLLSLYCGLFFARRKILSQHAEAYARQLIAEFMSK